MKFYSETLKKLFDSEEALVEAEKRQQEIKAKEEEERGKKLIAKREAENTVNMAIAKCEQAKKIFDSRKEKILDDLKKAEDEAEEILRKATEKADLELEEAENELNEAMSDEYEAIKNYNKLYGAFKKVTVNDSVFSDFLDELFSTSYGLF